MAESDFQRKRLTYAVDALDLHFHRQPQVYVSGNLLLYYEEGNPRVSVAPDVFEAFPTLQARSPVFTAFLRTSLTVLEQRSSAQ